MSVKLAMGCSVYISFFVRLMFLVLRNRNSFKKFETKDSYKFHLRMDKLMCLAANDCIRNAFYCIFDMIIMIAINFFLILWMALMTKSEVSIKVHRESLPRYSYDE
ncbi:hypothetical protein RF11_10123 [Thelohanellus kitauei]|uniref:Uncharacterized protein n=1 Tax=Thelohanellus kitauei TaxID=669202 RepID=A0A0C2J2D9_THEKT|nr:hypothetical protein RF11_10123 [Thelohanellus kitauei]